MIKQTKRFGIGGLCLLIGLLCLLPLYALADVNIDEHFPDANFQAYLKSLPVGADGKLTDEEIAMVKGIYVSSQSIASLEGLEVFTALRMLDCGDNLLTVLPQLPDTLTGLKCSENALTALPDLPETLTELLCDQNQLETLPTLSNMSLTQLFCESNQLSTLPALPNTLTTFNCSQNQLTALPELSTSLEWLYCGDNQLTALPQLPDGLTTLECSRNQLTALPKLPDGLTTLYCYNNTLTALPKLPNGLTTLYCYRNQLTALPKLPDGLERLYCHKNELTAVDLSSLSNLAYYLGRDQTPTLLLTANGAGGYSLAIELNTPSFSVTVLNYANGVLTSDSKTLDKSDFAVQTGKGNFQLDGTFTLTYGEIIAASFGEGGSITPSGKVGVAYGEDKTFTIASDTGYRIKDVLVNGTSIGKEASYTFENVQAAGSIEVQFELIPYTVTASKTLGGNITPLGKTTVLYGGSQSYTIAADEGYRIQDVKVNGKSLGVINSYTFSNVQANATIEAIFEERPIDPVPPTGDRFPLEMLVVSLVGMVLVAVGLLYKAKRV